MREQTFIEVLQSEKTRLLSEAGILTKIQAIDAAIDAYRHYVNTPKVQSMVVSPPRTVFDREKKSTDVTKKGVLDFITSSDKLLHIQEIQAFLNVSGNQVRNISVALQVLLKEGKIKKIKKRKNNKLVFYGLSHYFNDEGQPFDEYLSDLYRKA